MFRALVMSVAVLAGCGPGDREGSMPDAQAAPDSSLPRPDGQPAVCYSTPIEVEVALQIQIQQSCAIWNSLAKLAGRATVTRTGSNLSIDFGEGVVFAGTLTGNAVNLVYTHQHTFTDNCGWQAKETMAGQLDPGSCNFSLSYDYVESVVVNNGGCASPCSAQANVQLELTPIIL